MKTKRKPARYLRRSHIYVSQRRLWQCGEESCPQKIVGALCVARIRRKLARKSSSWLATASHSAESIVGGSRRARKLDIAKTSRFQYLAHAAALYKITPWRRRRHGWRNRDGVAA